MFETILHTIWSFILTSGEKVLVYELILTWYYIGPETRSQKLEAFPQVFGACSWWEIYFVEMTCRNEAYLSMFMPRKQIWSWVKILLKSWLPRLLHQYLCILLVIIFETCLSFIYIKDLFGSKEFWRIHSLDFFYSFVWFDGFQTIETFAIIYLVCNSIGTFPLGPT